MKYMSDENNSKIVRRLKLLEGQIRGLQKMVENDTYCIDVITQTSAVKQGLSNIEDVLLENHLGGCILNQVKSGQTNKAKEDLYSYLQKMRDSIIRMRLSYSQIDKLKEKINHLIEWERKYAKFFRPEDKETQELKKRMQKFEEELMLERGEKQRIIEDNNNKVAELSESLSSVKSRLNQLLLESSRRQHRLRALDQKIRQKADVYRYYHS